QSPEPAGSRSPDRITPSAGMRTSGMGGSSRMVLDHGLEAREVVLHLALRVAPERACDRLPDGARDGDVAERHLDARTVALGLETHASGVVHLGAGQRMPLHLAARLGDVRLRIPFDRHVRRPVDHPVLAVAAEGTHLAHVRHPLREALDAPVAEHVVHGRVHMDGLADHDAPATRAGADEALQVPVRRRTRDQAATDRAEREPAHAAANPSGDRESHADRPGERAPRGRPAVLRELDVRAFAWFAALQRGDAVGRLVRDDAARDGLHAAHALRAACDAIDLVRERLAGKGGVALDHADRDRPRATRHAADRGPDAFGERLVCDRLAGMAQPLADRGDEALRALPRLAHDEVAAALDLARHAAVPILETRAPRASELRIRKIHGERAEAEPAEDREAGGPRARSALSLRCHGRPSWGFRGTTPRAAGRFWA